MCRRPMMPLWVADYVNDTRCLTQAEHGCYLLLLMAAWHSPDGSLPNDNAQLRRLAGCHHHTWSQQRQSVLQRYFVQQTNGRWINPRLQKELAKADEIRLKRSEAGKTAAAAKATFAHVEGSTACTHSGGVNSAKPLKMAERASTNVQQTFTISTSTLEDKTQKEEKATPSGVAKEKAPAAPAPTTPLGSRLPAEWCMTDEHLTITRKEGFSDEEARRIAASFADYWHAKPGADARKCDWLATWRGWVRREADKRPKQGFAGAFNGGAGGYGAPRQVDRLTQAAQVVANRRNRANGHFS